MTVQTDVFLAHYGIEVSDVDIFLAHHGVPGMKWGHHKAQQVVTGTVGVAKKIGGAYANKAQASVDKSGGSKGKAITKAVGKDFVVGLSLVAGNHVFGQLMSGLAEVTGMNPRTEHAIRRGASKVAQILQIANHVQAAAKVTAIATRPSSKEKS